MSDDVDAVIDRFRDRGFHLAGRIEVTSVEGGRVRCRVDAAEDLANAFGTVHGGAASTLIDDVGTIAIALADRDGRSGVSTDLNVTWLAPLPVESTIHVDARVLKAGRSLAFVHVELRSHEDGPPAVVGRMTKFMT